jgi:hypothetical protein
LGGGLKTLYRRKVACNEMLYWPSELLAGSCEHGYEPFVSIKGGVFLNDYELLKENSATWS